jgi:Proto-chlorophyllide reductase 57 kD subunit
MKFLCVPCDTPMTLQTVDPPDRGSLSIVYACPECGYEIAMLTNAYETQVVQSLGVRIAPGGSREAVVDAAAGAGAASGAASASKASGGGCPFAAMIPGVGADAAKPPTEAIAVRWTAAAEARLANIPSFVRPMARTGIEQFARERGVMEVDEQMLDAAREFFGM